jgi:natural resistance-associated macrophage protein
LSAPVLAGSAAYAVGEARKWPTDGSQAFYAVVCIATIVGMIMNFTPIDPIRALYWSAVINGVVAAPVMAIMMWMAAAHKILGDFTAVTAAAVAAMLATSGEGRQFMQKLLEPGRRRSGIPAQDEAGSSSTTMPREFPPSLRRR